MIILVGDPEPVAPLSLAAQWIQRLRALESHPHFRVWLFTGGTMLALASIGGIFLLARASRRARRRLRRHGEFPGAIALRSIRCYPGIRNAGNSCYLNSIIQALASLQLPLLPQTPFNAHLLTLLSALNTPNIGPLDASHLVAAMGGVLNREQQDAHELLQALLSVLGKSVRRTSVPHSFSLESAAPLRNHLIYPRSASPPHGMAEAALPWEGWQAHCIRCLACGDQSGSGTRLHTFSMLVVPPARTLEAAFRESLRPDPLQDYLCECGRRGCSAKFSTITRWPAILIVHVQRTRVAGHTLAKNDDFMQFPSRMCAWSQDCNILGGAEIHRPSYELVSIVQHSGALGSGHYTAFRRVIEEGNRCRWLHCSDSAVQEVPLEVVLSAQAYILFYQSPMPRLDA